MTAKPELSEPQCVWSAEAQLGEGPVWSSFEDALYWVDIKAPAIHRFSPSTGEKDSWPMPSMVGCIIEEGRGQFLAGCETGFVRVRLGASGQLPDIHAIVDPEVDLPGNRFNDGKRAPDGSIWAGTMDNSETAASGKWWRLSPQNEVHCLGDLEFRVTNGPAFDTARARVFLTDSAKQTIYVAAYTDGMTELGELNTHLQFGDGDGYPDGMTVDDAGRLWVAFWDGHCIRCYAPSGRLLTEVQMPACRPTSIAVGADGDTLWITSARIGLDQPNAVDGGLFRLEIAPS